MVTVSCSWSAVVGCSVNVNVLAALATTELSTTALVVHDKVPAPRIVPTAVMTVLAIVVPVAEIVGIIAKFTASIVAALVSVTVNTASCSVPRICPVATVSARDPVFCIQTPLEPKHVASVPPTANAGLSTVCVPISPATVTMPPAGIFTVGLSVKVSVFAAPWAEVLSVMA
jgi:hypothetical protein